MLNGIAAEQDHAQRPGTTLGSVHYFSPEQARGEMVTPASDIYSAGLVLFEMLTGRRAWTGDSAGAVAVARAIGRPFTQQHACCSVKIGGSMSKRVGCAA